MGALRVIDFGRVSGLRSQTLWHAIAHGVSEGAAPTLSYMQPGEPYVSIGFHRSVSEIHPDSGLPVFRRMVGGGPVYIDDGQHFFQITVPVSMTPPKRSEAVRILLAPAVVAFRDVGVGAHLDDSNEVVVGDRKICGHAAGQIEQAVVVVGNLINRFDHEAAASIVSAPTATTHDEFLTQMRRYVTATPADPQAFFEALAVRYGEMLGLTSEPGALNGVEEGFLSWYDARFVDPKWVEGATRKPARLWRAKVKSGIWVGSAASNGYRVIATFQGKEVIGIRLEGTDREFPEMYRLLDELAASPPI